jgi:MPBQ/MSBQ methyltransferase
MTDKTRDVAAHYTQGGLGEAILSALKDAGKDPDKLTPEDLAPVDEFHVRGRAATVEVARLAGLDAGHHLLDVGCGIGGPSRHLASEFGCRVTGLDLTAEYCRVAAMLAERTGLSDRVEFRQGDALAMPFAEAGFDRVWTQHASMNIADKDGLIAEMHRVLKSGGRLALYDILAGCGGEVLYPVPWAREPAISFLDTPEALRGRLEAAGFKILTWRDVTAPARDWFREVVKRIQVDGTPPLGLHLLLGDDFPEMAGNMMRNLEEDRITLLQVVARKT